MRTCDGPRAIHLTALGWSAVTFHTPVIRVPEGVGYFKTGNWMESTSALVEDFSGSLKLVTHFEAEIEHTLTVDAEVFAG